MKLSCIIPAYNEGARIRAVIEAARAVPEIFEIIVVNDRSRDDTSAKARAFRDIHVIDHETNQGKTAALVTGFRAAKGDHILLLDADLEGLSAEAISALIAPIDAGKADISISLRKNAPRLWHWLGIDYISGERVFARSLIEAHYDALLQLPKFGFEVYLNGLVIDSDARIAVVKWPEVKSPYKAAKFGIWQGMKRDLAMIVDMIKTVGLRTIFAQIHTMRKRMIAAREEIE